MQPEILSIWRQNRQHHHLNFPELVTRLGCWHPKKWTKCWKYIKVKVSKLTFHKCLKLFTRGKFCSIWDSGTNPEGFSDNCRKNDEDRNHVWHIPWYILVWYSAPPQTPKKSHGRAVQVVQVVQGSRRWDKHHPLKHGEDHRDLLQWEKKRLRQRKELGLLWLLLLEVGYGCIFNENSGSQPSWSSSENAFLTPHSHPCPPLLRANSLWDHRIPSDHLQYSTFKAIWMGKLMISHGISISGYPVSHFRKCVEIPHQIEGTFSDLPIAQLELQVSVILKNILSLHLQTEMLDAVEIPCLLIEAGKTVPEPQAGLDSTTLSQTSQSLSQCSKRPSWWSDDTHGTLEVHPMPKTKPWKLTPFSNYHLSKRSWRMAHIRSSSSP